jgi:signal peptide peptidase SppA
MKYKHVYAHVIGQPWAILPEKLATICKILRTKACEDCDEELSEAEIRAHVGAGPKPRPSTPGTVAVIPVYGVISKRMNMMTNYSGGTSIEKLTSSFRQAMADSTVKAIVLDVDSPGGTVDGVPELADEILAARDQKKVVAQVDGMAASAAYWLACQASELIVTPSGSVGSIGVFAEHEDLSKALETEGVKVSLISAGKYKTDGNPYEPLSDTARADLQNTVDAFYAMFTKSVAKGRGVSPADVRGGFGEGRLVLAAEAVKLGMADKVATMDQTLSRFGVSAPAPATAGRASLAARSREIDLA